MTGKDLEWLIDERCRCDLMTLRVQATLHEFGVHRVKNFSSARFDRYMSKKQVEQTVKEIKGY